MNQNFLLLINAVLGSIILLSKTSLNSFIYSNTLTNFYAKNLGINLISNFLLGTIYCIILLIFYLIVKRLITKIYLESEYIHTLKIIIFSIIDSIKNSRSYYLIHYKLTNQYIARKIDLAYFILRVYRFIRTPVYLPIRSNIEFKTSLKSWLSFIFKLLLFAGFIYYLISDTTSSLLSLTTPLFSIELESQLKQKLLEIEQIRLSLLSIKKYDYQTLDFLFKPKNKDIKYLPLPKFKTRFYEQSETKIKFLVTGFSLDQSDNYKAQLELLYYSITSTKEYQNLSLNKKMIILGINDFDRNAYHPVHSSVVLTNQTSFQEYYKKISQYLHNHWFNHYEVVVNNRFMVIVTSLDSIVSNTIQITKKNKISGINARSYSTMIEGRPSLNESPITPPKPKVNSFSIKPLRDRPIKKLEKFCCMDIETMILDKNTNEHIPVAISLYSEEFKELFLIDPVLLLKDKNAAVKQTI